MIRIGSVGEISVEDAANAPCAERSRPLLPRPRGSVDSESPAHKPAA